jgi:hypothetical protein
MATIGINVIETDGSAAPAIAGAPTSVGGVLLRSRRGPAGTPVRVSSFRDFAARFGAHDARFTGAYAVEGLFANGGHEAHIVRVTDTAAVAARVTLLDRAGNSGLQVTAGYRGSEDPGTWGNDLYLTVRDNPEVSRPLTATRAGAQPARLQGNAFAATTVDLSVAAGQPARKLRLVVDSGPTFDVTFSAATVLVLAAATAQDVADAIAGVAGARVRATASSGGILLVSRAKGAASKVEVAAGFDDPTRALLGLELAGAANASTAAGAAAPAGAYDELEVASLSGLDIGDWVRLDDGISSDWQQITALEQRPVGGGGVQFVVHFATPPAGEQNEYRTQDGATLSTTEFDLVIGQRDASAPAPLPVEVWSKVTMDSTAARYVPNLVNDPFSGSRYVTVTDPSPGAYAGRDVPQPLADVRLGQSTPATATLARRAGADGGDPPVSAYRAALGALDVAAVQLILAPEVMADGALRAITRAGLDYCAARGDCMFIASTPLGRDEAGARAFGQEFRAAKAYGAMYWPWITVSDPVGAGPNPIRQIPPTGHVAGVYARTDELRGVWKAPAGDEALVRGALAVERSITDQDHDDLVRNGSVNGIRPIAGVGIAIDASRTLSTDTRWLYVNVRLLFNYVKASLRDGLRWVRQEPNREALWGMVKYGTITPFLLRLFQAGAFGPGTPADVFTVVCGPENNPPDQITLGNLRIEVYFYPSRPAETILIVVGQQDSGATAGER